MDKYLENKRAAIASVVALGAVGFAGYWLLSGGTAPPAGGAEAKRPGSKKKKNKKKSGKKNLPTSHGFPTAQEGSEGPLYPVIDDWSRVASLPETDRKQIGEEFKAAGNAAFGAKQFDKALELYSNAIRAYPKDAVFYANRAAVWGSWKNFEEVVKDTSEGLRLRPDYVKCYTRRAVAHENLRNYREAVMDYTSAVILQNFHDDSLGQSVDRVLRAEAEVRMAAEGGQPSKDFPSANFVRSYLQSFHPRALPASVEQATEGSAEYELKLAFDAMDKENQESYKQAFHLIQAVTTLGGSKKFTDKTAEALAYEYLATFQSLCNETEPALAAINQSLALNPTVPAYLKRSAVLIESGLLRESEQDFTNARNLDPESADLYYQLAQVEFLQGQWEQAKANYERSIKIDSKFTLARVQLAVTLYRMDRIDEAKQQFEQLIAEKPEEAQAYNYYGEILLDLKESSAAQAQFQKAIDLEQARQGSAINVLPIVNMSMAIMQDAKGPSDVERALEVCQRAATIDPQSDVAVGSLAQFELQLGRTSEAVKLFERNAKLARTPSEQLQSYTFAEAARTQLRIAAERPIVRERLEFLSKLQQR